MQVKNFQKIWVMCLFIIGVAFPVSDLNAQKPAGNQKEFETDYKWRIRQEILYGVYIPANISEAIVELTKKMDADSKKKFLQVSEDEAAKRTFFSLGRWISHNWGFYGGSRLSVDIRNLGIYHPDEQARFLIVLLHRSLGKRPLEVKALAATFIETAEAQKQKELEDAEILFEETRKRPKPKN